jgi:hypothetical protein
MVTTNSQCDDLALYEAVASRRAQWDNLLWQVPVLSFTAQAFLFTIALGADTRLAARILACLLSLVITVLSIHLMCRHRQADVTDAEWLEEYEQARFGETVHGHPWRDRRNKNSAGGWPARIRGFPVWIAGMTLIGIAALVVLGLSIWSSLLVG